MPHPDDVLTAEELQELELMEKEYDEMQDRKRRMDQWDSNEALLQYCQLQYYNIPHRAL